MKIHSQRFEYEMKLTHTKQQHFSRNFRLKNVFVYDNIFGS